MVTIKELANFYKNKKVFITGHTGFKGSWLSILLESMGAKVSGYALEPPTNPSLFELSGISSLINHTVGDIRDINQLKKAIEESAPEIIFHMAAQPLVRESYQYPVETYQINVMGTVNLLDTLRTTKGVKAFVNVTTDKVYENKEWIWGYRENEPFGGYDPYSNSKACSELVTDAFRSSYFNPSTYKEHGLAIASARAGNVIGGGDWASDRIIPDIIKSLIANKSVQIRNPHAIRPWQHVLEPLTGYLQLAMALYNKGAEFAQGWNFGPDDADCMPVGWLTNYLYEKWGSSAQPETDKGNNPHEAHFLKLDCTKAKTYLNWQPRWNITKALDATVEWYKAYLQGKNVREICLEQAYSYYQT